MSRLNIPAPEITLFRMERKVGLSDINYAKHLDSVSMVKVLHEARLQFLANLGFTESNIYGLGLVITGLTVDYRSESFANDLLVIDRSLSPAHNKIAVCFLDGEFTVKRLRVKNDEVWLQPENKNYKAIRITEANDFVIWGIVTNVIKKV